MDSYSQSSSFLNLLTSQQPITQHPYHSAPDSPSIGEVPFCSSQWNNEVGEDEHTVDDRKGRRKWSPTEDVVLISAWLNTSKDPVVGNEQKAAAFWKRIAAYFASSPKLTDLPKKREPNHCKQRWCKINEGVCKFVGSYDAATKEKTSGQNENDVVKLAHEIFYNDYKVKFTLEHAWRELRHDQKWCGSSTKDNGKSKKRRCDTQSVNSSTPVSCGVGDDEEIARPPGVKASKGKGKTAVSKPKSMEEEGKVLEEFQGMWEIKEKDFAMKKEMLKHTMLDSLLAKTEPLTEIEVTLKNKLINDFLAS